MDKLKRMNRNIIHELAQMTVPEIEGLRQEWLDAVDAPKDIRQFIESYIYTVTALVIEHKQLRMRNGKEL